MPAITSLDLSNAKLDVDHIAAIATSTLPTATDRLGHTKDTVVGAVNSIKAFIPKGARINGATYNIKDVYTEAGIAYVAVVPSFVSVSISYDLAAGNVVYYQNGINSPNSANQVPMTNQDKLSESSSIRNWGGKGDGSTNESTYLRKAQLDTTSVYFPSINNSPTTYFFSGVIPSDFGGMTITADSNVTLSLGSNEYNLYSNTVFNTDVKVFFRDISVKYVFPKTESNYKKSSIHLPLPPTVRSNTAIDATSSLLINARTTNFPTSDVFSDSSVTRAVDSIVFAATVGTQSFKGAYFELGLFETISAYFDNGFTAGPLGVILRTDTGYFVIYKGSGTGNYYTAYKAVGFGITGNTANIPWTAIGQGVYTSFDGNNSVWSVNRIASDKVVIKLNGCALTLPVIRDIGNIHEVGFVCFTDQEFKISGFTLERRHAVQTGVQRIDKIRFFGDSRVATFPGSFSSYIKPILDCEFGLKVVSVDNFGLAGSQLSDSLSKLKTNGTGGATYIGLNAGTNSIQGTVDINSFKADLEEFADFCYTYGARPVFLIPGMFYTQAQSGGIGQNSANYDKGAPYRMLMERVACNKKCLIVKISEEMPNPDPAYLVSDPGAALLRDNIHEDNMGEQLVAKAFCQAIADDILAIPEAMESPAAPFNFLNGSSSTDFVITTSKSRMTTITGTLDLPTTANGTSLVKLPRWARPLRSTNFTAQAVNAAGAAMLGPCYINYDPTTSTLKLYLAPAGTGKIILDSCSYMT